MMPSAGPRACVALLAACIGIAAGCGGDRGVAAKAGGKPVAAAAAAAQSPPTSPQTVHLTGLLTLMGAEQEAWWALSDSTGQLWRVDPASEAQSRQFRQWQNQRVAIDGVRAGTLLRTEIVQVQSARRLD